MKLTIFLSMLLCIFNSHAELSVDIDNTSFSCEKKSDQIFYCGHEGVKFLVFKNAMGYSAVGKNDYGVPDLKWVTRVNDSGKILFEIPSLLGGNTADNIFKGAESLSGRLESASSVINLLKDVSDELAQEFITISESFMAKEKVPKPKVLILADQKKIECVRGEDRPLTVEEKKYEASYNLKLQCDFYSCKGENDERILSYVPGPGSLASPYFLNLKGAQTDLRFDSMKIVEPDNEALPIYEIPSLGYQGSHETAIDENLFIPSQFEKNKMTFSFFTNPMMARMRENVHKLCAGDNDVTKLISEEHKTAELFQEALVKAELGHYLTLVNGLVLSVFVDAQKANGLGCRYDGMILSKEAEKHIAYLQKAKPKVIDKFLTEDEVQDLFFQAKNMVDVPFGYKYDGCYARAHAMARRFEAMGIPVEKVWIKGSLYVPGTDVQWNYHVAPVVNVKTKSGEIKKYVIDPSLTQKAVTVDGWVASMGKNVKGGVVQTTYPFPINAASFQRTAVAFSSSDIYVPDNDEMRSEEQNMALAIQTMKEYSAALLEKPQAQER